MMPSGSGLSIYRTSGTGKDLGFIFLYKDPPEQVQFRSNRDDVFDENEEGFGNYLPRRGIILVEKA